MTQFNTLQQIKRDFFAMRNGALADKMRRLGVPYRIIFGLNLPQIIEISRRYRPDAAIAGQLWANTSTRESLLLAPMLYPRDEMDPDTAATWMAQCSTAEVADILCHRLLRHRPFALPLAQKFADSPRDIERYTALRLLFNLLPANIDYARSTATAELQRNNPLTASIARNMLDEIEYLVTPCD